jgi:hypothetical protein
MWGWPSSHVSQEPNVTGIRVVFSWSQAGPRFRQNLTRQATRVREAARGAARETAKRIETLGRADIRRGGNFGSRWTDGLHADVTEGGGNIRISVYDDVPYFNIFQYGGVIKGKPMLWIPLDFATDAQGVSAKDFRGGLFRVDRESGAPLLLSIEDKQPKYFGKESVTEPKKFHIVEIAQDQARRMRDIYRERFKELG